MPLIIDGADFDEVFNDPERNASLTYQFLSQGVDNVRIQGLVIQRGYRLIKSCNYDEYRLISNEERPLTIYAVKLSHKNFMISNLTICTQVMVWRTLDPRDLEAVQGLASKFFDYFLCRYSIVITDINQTKEGKRFWLARIYEAFEKVELSVYVFNNKKIGKEKPNQLTRMTSWQEFYKYWHDYCWGTEIDSHSNRLIVISKDILA